MSWPDLTEPKRATSLRKRLGWMVLIWMLSILALGAVAYLLRLWIR